MFFIVVWHFIVHGVMYNPESEPMSLNLSSTAGVINFMVTEYLVFITGVAVNCYVLISGYFLVKSNFKFDKIIKVWLQTVFYSFLICLILYLTGIVDINFKQLLASAAPVTCGAYWFVVKYIALVSISPFLSKLALILNRRDYQLFLCVLAVLCLQFFRYFPYGGIYGAMGGFGFIWFIFLFFVAGYIRLYEPFSRYSRYFGKCFLLFCLILAVGILFRESLVLFWKDKLPSYTGTSYNGFTFFSSVLLFLWGKYHTFSDNAFYRFIIKMAPYTFGVYLIHDNHYIRGLLWHQWIVPNYYLDSWMLLPIMAGSSVIIYLSCTFIDCLRDKLFSSLHIDNHLSTIGRIVKRIVFFYFYNLRFCRKLRKIVR